MRRSTVLLGLAVTAGAVVTVGSGWRVARPTESRGASGTQSGAQARMGASRGAGYGASQWAERNGPRQVDGLEVAEAETEWRRETEGAAALPWLHNFAATAESRAASAVVVERMA